MDGKKVLIIGLGLIGGSIGRAIKAKHASCFISGYDVDREQVDQAKSSGIIDEAASSIKSYTEQADFIIIATPVTKTADIIDLLINHCLLKRNAIITDVGSTKQTIMDQAKHFPPEVTFIGGHPLAGSEKSGVGAANGRLFEQSYYVLITNKPGDTPEMDTLKKLLDGTGAIFITMTAEEHDRITGMISHFPHMMAASLVHLLTDRNHDEGFDMRQLAAGGFRDITRIASASPRMWHDILLENRSVLIDLMKEWQEEMERVQSMIHNMDSEGIYHYFDKAKQYRDELP
ncbi:MAG TPA: prephenate dehydrogenase [Virgibacillus sp.]|nr:prephenate dehydrogenase [Virgibacillus sp.]